MIRVNHQNFVQFLCFAVFMALLVFAARSYAQEDAGYYDTSILQKGAENGVAESQFLLGEAYRDGKNITQNLILSYVWLSLAAEQGYDNADIKRDEVLGMMLRNHRPTARAQAKVYYDKYVKPFLPPFEVNVNGKKVIKSSEIEVETPLYIIFKHVDENIALVRMLYPKNMHKHEDFEMNRPYRMEKHEALLDAGRTTGAMFIALDATGNVYNKMKIIMKPAPKEDDKPEDGAVDEKGEKSQAGNE